MKMKRRIIALLAVTAVMLSLPAAAAAAPSAAAPAGSYKHIDSSNPYNIDALTSATLTVEGPGVAATTPIAVRELEAAAPAVKAVTYTNGAGKTYTYEGADVLSIIDGAINTNVLKTDEQVVVVFKNRWRQDIATIAYQDLKAATAAGKPVLLAHGVSDGKTTAPFVFDLATGFIPALDNADGPVRLVYDASVFKSGGTNAPIGTGAFKSCAYMYVQTGAGEPGFKHSTAADKAYDNPVNLEFLITLTGSALGREVNYTVSELEAMVEYDTAGNPKAGGIGWRDSYSLSNTTYWYVNQYEGINLWQLLTQKLGISASKYAGDKDTLVSFASWDNYRTLTEFSMYQLAHPETSYFYEKSPLDIGTSRPTKAQLATEEYQPTNSGAGTGDWTRDANGYPVKTGYPVLLAYGVNGYPYVPDSDTPGYFGGLGNDGGPMKVIYGKTDGMNRSNPAAEENYAYFFNNGSNQLQKAQEIYVGDGARFSTHSQNPGYNSMANSPGALTVEIVSTTGAKTAKTYTLAELENVLYGAAKRDMDTQGRQEKGYYPYNMSGGKVSDELFEGVNLWYLLSEDIGMAGYLGTVSMYAEGSASPAAELSLEEIREAGYNSLRGTAGLGAMVAFAKNGYPLVRDSGSAGYVAADSVTGKQIGNSGGPLMFIRAQNESERASGTVSVGGDKRAAVSRLAKIVVNLEADPYSHGEEEGKATVSFTGAVMNSAGTVLTVSELETKQKYMVTGEYAIGGVTNEYRGLDLFRLVNDPAIGASASMEAVIVSNDAGQQTTLTASDLRDASMRVILAYGVTDVSAGSSGGTAGASSAVSSGSGTGAGSAGDSKSVDGAGRPLAASEGGPMRLVINGASANECITNVTKIEIVAAKGTGWTHSFGNFLQYADYTIGISGSNLSKSVTYTVADIEAMENIVVNDGYQLGGAIFAEGVDLYKLLQTIGFANGLTTSEITVYAADGYAVALTGTDVEKGVNGKPVLLAYAQGSTATNGLPLVPYDTDAGFDPNVGNAYGPLRLIVHDNSGWCNKWVSRIVVGAEVAEVEKPAFVTYEAGVELPFAGTRSIAADGAGGFWVGSYGGGLSHINAAGVSDSSGVSDNSGVSDSSGGSDSAGAADADEEGDVPGSGSASAGVTVYNSESAPALKSDFVSAIAVDKAGGVWFSQNASYTDLTLNRGLGYLRDGEITWYEKGDEIPDNYIQAIEIDCFGNVWFGSFGGLTRFDGETWMTWAKTGEDSAGAGNDVGTVTNSSAGANSSAGSASAVPGLPYISVSTIKSDKQGGVWVGFYPDGGGAADDLFRGGYIHMDKDGNIDYRQDYVGEYSELAGSSLLADAWVRNFAIDTDGDVWVVRSGSYANMPTSVGGRIDCVEDMTYAGEGYRLKQTYTGEEFLGSMLKDKGEIRAITADPIKGVWFGTTTGGVVYKATPPDSGTWFGIINSAWGRDNVTLDNVYSLGFSGGALYVGSAGGAAVNADAGVFPDVTNHWAREDIITLSGLGIVNGYADRTFKPDDTLTRAQFITMLYRLAGKDGAGAAAAKESDESAVNAENDIDADIAADNTTGTAADTTNDVPPSGGTGFTDVAADAYYVKAVMWATENGIARGVGDGKFAPDAQIARQDMAVIISNYIHCTGWNAPFEKAPITFADSGDIAGYAAEAVSFIQQHGIINGRTATAFAPLGYTTRAEAAAVLVRLLIRMNV